MSKCWSIELTFPTHKVKTFVYSNTGKDIAQRFKEDICKVKVIKEINNPIANTVATPKKKEEYI